MRGNGVPTSDQVKAPVIFAKSIINSPGFLRRYGPIGWMSSPPDVVVYSGKQSLSHRRAPNGASFGILPFGTGEGVRGSIGIPGPFSGCTGGLMHSVSSAEARYEQASTVKFVVMPNFVVITPPIAPPMDISADHTEASTVVASLRSRSPTQTCGTSELRSGSYCAAQDCCKKTRMKNTGQIKAPGWPSRPSRPWFSPILSSSIPPTHVAAHTSQKNSPHRLSTRSAIEPTHGASAIAGSIRTNMKAAVYTPDLLRAA